MSLLILLIQIKTLQHIFCITLVWTLSLFSILDSYLYSWIVILNSYLSSWIVILYSYSPEERWKKNQDGWYNIGEDWKNAQIVLLKGKERLRLQIIYVQVQYAKWQWRNKWSAVSILSLHTGERMGLEMPSLARRPLVNAHFFNTNQE